MSLTDSSGQWFKESISQALVIIQTLPYGLRNFVAPKRLQIHCVRRENTAVQCAVWPLVVVMIFRTSDSQAPLHPPPSAAVVHLIESSQLLALSL